MALHVARVPDEQFPMKILQEGKRSQKGEKNQNKDNIKAPVKENGYICKRSISVENLFIFSM